MSGTANELGSGWYISSEPPPELDAWAQRGRCLFATGAWADVVRSLGAEALFAWHAARGLGAMVPVFRRFGLRIGFLGFPVAGADFDALDSDALARCAAGVAAAARLDVVRATQSMRTQIERAAISGRREVWIADLPHWQLDAHKRLRKDLAFVRRSAPTLVLLSGNFDANACFELYLATVSRHGGQQRYDAAYFAALRALAQESDLLGFFVAVEGSSVKGFAVVALHGGVAYYLHGAVDAVGRRHGVNDALLARLVAFSRDAGATRFTLMASPWGQPGLQEFKQKWGDTTGLSVTSDHAGSLLGQGAVLVSRWQRRHDWRQAASFVACPAECAKE